MGGVNPYIEKSNVRLPKRKYRITVINHEADGKITTIDVDPAALPLGDAGLPGSILDILLGNKIDLNHSCGGVCACSTCHVYVTVGAKSLNEPGDAELDELDQAPELRPASRLGCQTVPDGSSDITVEIPRWNRNAIREGH